MTCNVVRYTQNHGEMQDDNWESFSTWKNTEDVSTSVAPSLIESSSLYPSNSRNNSTIPSQPNTQWDKDAANDGSLAKHIGYEPMDRKSAPIRRGSLGQESVVSEGRTKRRGSMSSMLKESHNALQLQRSTDHGAIPTQRESTGQEQFPSTKRASGGFGSLANHFSRESSAPKRRGSLCQQSVVSECRSRRRGSLSSKVKAPHEELKLLPTRRRSMGQQSAPTERASQGCGSLANHIGRDSMDPNSDAVGGGSVCQQSVVSEGRGRRRGSMSSILKESHDGLLHQRSTDNGETRTTRELMGAQLASTESANQGRARRRGSTTSSTLNGRHDVTTLQRSSYHGATAESRGSLVQQPVETERESDGQARRRFSTSSSMLKEPRDGLPVLQPANRDTASIRRGSMADRSVSPERTSQGGARRRGSTSSSMKESDDGLPFKRPTEHGAGHQFGKHESQGKARRRGSTSAMVKHEQPLQDEGPINPAGSLRRYSMPSMASSEFESEELITENETRHSIVGTKVDHNSVMPCRPKQGGAPRSVDLARVTRPRRASRSVERSDPSSKSDTQRRRRSSYNSERRRSSRSAERSSDQSKSNLQHAKRRSQSKSVERRNDVNKSGCEQMKSRTRSRSSEGNKDTYSRRRRSSSKSLERAGEGFQDRRSRSKSVHRRNPANKSDLQRRSRSASAGRHYSSDYLKNSTQLVDVKSAEGKQVQEPTEKSQYNTNSEPMQQKSGLKHPTDNALAESNQPADLHKSAEFCYVQDMMLDMQNSNLHPSQHDGVTPSEGAGEELSTSENVLDFLDDDMELSYGSIALVADENDEIIGGTNNKPRRPLGKCLAKQTSRRDMKLSQQNAPWQSRINQCQAA